MARRPDGGMARRRDRSMDDVEGGQRPVTRSVCLVAVFTGLVMAGCTSPKTADRPALRPVTLPDLSQMAESARQQIEERHASMLQTIESRTASVADLSSAYGEMGKLLMAAQYADPAEACFVNAQTLDPSEFR